MFDRTVSCLEFFQGQTSVALGFLHPAPVGSWEKSPTKFYAQKQLQHLAEKKPCAVHTKRGPALTQMVQLWITVWQACYQWVMTSDDQSTLDSTFAQILHT